MAIHDCLSVQLYSLRSLESLDAILDAVAAAGYGYVECTGGHLMDAANVRKMLDARGLKATTTHVGLDQLRKDVKEVVGAAETLGITDLYMPAVPREERDMDADGWRAVGRELAGFADAVTKAGRALGYHNHHWELAPKDGKKTALEILFESAGSSPLRWQCDVAWLVRGYADPKAWMERYRDKLLSLHVKDLAPAGQNEDEDGWAAVGSGVLDWPGLWTKGRALGASWMVVEHDKPAHPAANVKSSYAYLTSMKV